MKWRLFAIHDRLSGDALDLLRLESLEARPGNDDDDDSGDGDDDDDDDDDNDGDDGGGLDVSNHVRSRKTHLRREREKTCKVQDITHLLLLGG